MISPPRAMRTPTERGLHGRRKIDDYAWMEDSAWSEVVRDATKLRPEHRAHLDAENAYAASQMAPHDALRRELLDELRARQPEEERSARFRDGPWTYFASLRRGNTHPDLRRSGPRDEVLVDGGKEAGDRSFYRLGPFCPSPDHALLAYCADEHGDDGYVLSVLRLADRVVTDRIEDVTSFAWSADGQTILYTQLDRHHRPSHLRCHALGTDPKTDPILLEESDPAFFFTVAPSKSRRFVFVEARDHAASEAWLVDAARPAAPPRLIVSRTRRRRCSFAEHGDDLFILHDGTDAEDFMISCAPLDDPAPGRWRTIVPHRRGRVLRELAVFGDHLAYVAIEDASPSIVMQSLVDGTSHVVPLDEAVCDLALEPPAGTDDASLRFRRSSPTTPLQCCELRAGERTPRVIEQDVVPGHDPERYVATRLHAIAHDGETIPISLVRARSTELGAAPLVLYVYGSYGTITPASFDAARLGLLDRGIIYAIAHVRGGRERGRRWYDAGKGMQRPSSVRDVVSTAEWLVAGGYARRGAIVLHGASAGGTLVAAAANLSPSTFRAVVAEVPFVDVLATLCDRSQPLTPREHREWGDPTTSAEAYDLIASYSPVDNVQGVPYPHVLATAGVTDPWVPWWEPAKWIATLRERTTGDAPFLLETAMSAGHRGGAGKADRLAATARLSTFMLTATGSP